MPRHVVRLTAPDGAWYLEWSTVVDAPVTFGMRRGEFARWYADEYGRDGVRGLAERFDRADATGCSARDGTSLAELLAANRAGPGETALTRDEIVEWYCRRRRDPGAKVAGG